MASTFNLRIPLANQAALDALAAIALGSGNNIVQNLHVALVPPTGVALNAGTTVAFRVGPDANAPLGVAIAALTSAFQDVGIPARFCDITGTLNAADNGASLLLCGEYPG